jgi:putative ABC transport system permease protein
MIAKIAWKNIWRNKLRSLVVIISIILGLWAGTFILAYIFGIMDQRLEDAIGYETSHVQIHQPEFLSDNDPQFVIPNSAQLLNELAQNDAVAAATGRLLAYGMVAAATTSSGGKFIGIDPAKEQAVTQLANSIVEGEYLEAGDKSQVVIGQKLADKLKVKLRSKVVFTFQDADHNIVSGAFRIKGIFKSYNSGLEENNLYVSQPDLDKLMNVKGQVHEVAVLLWEADGLIPFIANIQSRHNDRLIRSWKEIAPELALMVDSIQQYLLIFLVIILLALSFGIVNTMLMAVLERGREIGVLMAIGMNKFRLFSMIFLETFFIIGLAAPVGLLLAYASISYLGDTGIDLSGLYKDSYASFGIKTIIHPQLKGFYYLQILTMVAITALLAAIYPAYTALRLDPVKAIRKM